MFRVIALLVFAVGLAACDVISTSDRRLEVRGSG